MEQVRYKQRICEDKEKIHDFLSKTRTGIIGMATSDFPYCVPVNYVWLQGSIYFHGMGSGKKVEILDLSPKVTFLVYEEFGTVKDKVPCHADTSYISIMLFGKVEKLSAKEEKANALQAIVDKFMPGFYKEKITSALAKNYSSSHDNQAVAVYKIKPEHITAKENIVSDHDLFSPKE